MYVPRATSSSWLLLLPFLLLLLPLAASQASTKWQTLSGSKPVVVARGGFSGILPDSSIDAYNFALMFSVPDVVLWCDVQLTKDGSGICAPDVNLANSTYISAVYPNSSTYKINGVSQTGWFSVDYTFNDLQSVTLSQGIYSRTNKFDGNNYLIQRPEDVVTTINQSMVFWLNIQHDAFFTQHNLSARNYVLSVTRKIVVSHISSPEVAFLRNIASRFNPKVTKLILRFLTPDEIEPTTKQTYNSLLNNLTFIKTFASGILVPKCYVWPVDNGYLLPHNSLVSHAHKAGLEVYTSEFYNDVPFSFNCSYDPVTEYLYHMDNGDFSVDGVLSDFPITPSEARDCFAHLGKNAAEKANLTVITKNGASGDYTGGTDLAYQKAIADGADVIDCSVQISEDNIPFCMSSINLIDSTTVIQSSFSDLKQEIPELQSGSGIFSFSLNWSQIQNLTAMIASPYYKYTLLRNPNYKNAGKFLTLAEFLSMAKNSSSLSGVLISIENAAYLIEKKNKPIIDLLLDALKSAGYDSETSKTVMIQSTSSAALMKFKNTSYELVYDVGEDIGDALDSAIDDIKSFSHSVVVSKSSVIKDYDLFLKSLTDVVPKLQKANLSVYVKTFSNEFVSQAWDFFSDATVEINSYVSSAGINGVVTDFPRTSARYKRNRCLGNNSPTYMTAVQPGGLLNLILATPFQPPAEAPNPTLTDSEVEESPLPDATEPTPAPTAGTTGGTPTSPSKSSAGCLVSTAATILAHLAVVAGILLHL